MQINTSQCKSMQVNTCQYKSIQVNTSQCKSIQYKSMQVNASQYKSIKVNESQYKSKYANTSQCKSMQVNASQYKSMQVSASQYTFMRAYIGVLLSIWLVLTGGLQGTRQDRRLKDTSAHACAHTDTQSPRHIVAVRAVREFALYMDRPTTTPWCTGDRPTKTPSASPSGCRSWQRTIHRRMMVDQLGNPLHNIRQVPTLSGTSPF
jgi:hypothetical protein